MSQGLDSSYHRAAVRTARARAQDRHGRLSPGSTGRAALLFLFLALIPSESARASGSLIFMPNQWNFGVIPDSKPIHLLVTVRNGGTEAVRVSFIATCDCLFAPPGQVEIAPQGEQVFRLIFDPAGYEGFSEKDFIVRSTAPGQEKALFRVYGEVRVTSPKKEEAVEERASGAPGGIVRLSYIYSSGCRSCERFLSQQIPALEEELGIKLEVSRTDIFDTKAYERYLRLLERLGEQERSYPAVVVGDLVLQGEREIESGLREAIITLAAGADRGAGPAAAEPPAEGGAPVTKKLDLAVLPVIAAGLLDGINPCAFTTLIFLVSALAVAGKSRRQVLVLGLFYSASVFVTYFLIGLGFLSAVRYAQSFFLVARILRWALVGALAVFAGLSFYDYLQLRRGKTAKVVLQLPSALKRQIHSSIRSRARSAALLGSALALGFLVTLFELACTGQVYLPTIIYAVRTGKQLRSYAYLLLYNLGFIAPLLVVFALSFTGLGLKGLTAFFQKSVAAVKLAMAGLFVGLAVITILI